MLKDIASLFSRCALIAGGPPALPASRRQVHTPEQVCKSRVRAQWVIDRIRLNLAHQIRFLCKGFFEPEERFIIGSETNVDPGDTNRHDVFALVSPFL